MTPENAVEKLQDVDAILPPNSVIEAMLCLANVLDAGLTKGQCRVVAGFIRNEFGMDTNGAVIQDDKKRFGVNCFGYKPKITSLEEELMANTTPYPLTKKDILFEKEVEFWKKQIKNILVSPFNYNTWSRI